MNWKKGVSSRLARMKKAIYALLEKQKVTCTTDSVRASSLHLHKHYKLNAKATIERLDQILESGLDIHLSHSSTKGVSALLVGKNQEPEFLVCGGTSLEGLLGIILYLTPIEEREII